MRQHHVLTPACAAICRPLREEVFFRHVPDRASLLLGRHHLPAADLDLLCLIVIDRSGHFGNQQIGALGERHRRHRSDRCLREDTERSGVSNR